MKFEINENMHPFLVGRFIGSRILYANYKNEPIDNLIKEASKLSQYFLKKIKIEFWLYPYFQHMLADYLNLAGLFKESYEIIRSIQHFNKNYEIETGYKEALNIISKIAHHSVPSFDYEKWYYLESAKNFHLINPLFKKYQKLQALCVYHSVVKGKKREKSKNEINALIEQTGFTYFSNYIS